MAENVNVKNTGLRGITVADTKISFIDGEQGILIYRGYRIEDLAEKASFMEVASLLLYGTLPSRKDLARFESEVLSSRKLPDPLYDAMKTFPKNADPMDVLQATVPVLAMADPDLLREERDANVRMATRLLARIPLLMAAWDRIRKGLDPLPSDDSLSHAANFLWLLSGRRPSPSMAKDLDTCLVLHADHTFNASTFACRQVASTRAHLYAGVAAGIGALSGSLHGGANTRVMKMLLELGSEEDIPSWVRKRLDSGERIMGMGHAVYKTMDPRAVYLKEMGSRLAEETGEKSLYQRSLEVERAAGQEFEKRGKKEIRPNVDFYSAPVYHMMGIPLDLMTPVFAMSRVAGWGAHIIEEKFGEAQGKPALYRPKAEYVGAYCGLMGCEYAPLDNREA
jgi:citrate synthase